MRALQQWGFFNLYRRLDEPLISGRPYQLRFNMSKLDKLELDELYGMKPTPAVTRSILLKSDFTQIDARYCEKICKLKCKSTGSVRLNHSPVDILIIQDHANLPGKFDRSPYQQDMIQAGVIDFIFRKALEDEGFSKNDPTPTYRVHSLLKCTPSKDDFKDGKPPTQTTLQRCLPYLKNEIEAIKPKVIVSLGTASTKSLGMLKKSNTGNRGEVVLSEYGPLVITLNPKILTYIRQNARGAGGMWGPDYLGVIRRDLRKAIQIATGKLIVKPDTLETTVKSLMETQIKVARTLDDVTAFRKEIDSLPIHKVVSFDTETTSLDPLDPTLKLLTIQFGWTDPERGTQARVIPLWHRANTAYDPEEAWTIITPILTGERPKVGHNSKYDILVIYWSKNVRVRNVKFDTLLLLHSIESGTQGCYGLKTACWDHLYSKGYAGYEDDLGDLKKIQKQVDSEAEEVDSAPPRSNPVQEEIEAIMEAVNRDE